jgi:hypothetical protein
MRLTTLVAATLLLSISDRLSAQEWIEFANRDDRFTCNFPSPPQVREFTYRSQHEADLPARVYSATQGKSRYSVTVVDYNQAQRILTEKAKSCPAGAEPCLGGAGDEGHWKADIRGAIDYASWQLLQRDAKLTIFVWSVVDMVEGHQMQFVNNIDKSRTFAGVYMHENRLYIIEGTVPAGYPEPALFQQSLGWLDENGVGLRYQSYYSNGFPAPPRVNRAGRGQGQGRIDAPDANSGQRR